ncbi:unnamed protein product [Clavelina lepadiformis]|uniref:Glucosylceramidase n=1 Tax=Clavelina lepadiformis TaxID=159417 RepID=A0ABP0FT45_CLALP
MRIDKNILFYLCLIIIKTSADSDAPCISRDYGHGSVVCVCNATYCDTVVSTRPVPFQSVSIYSSTKSGSRFDFGVQKLFGLSPSINTNPTVITLDFEKRYQMIKGFGGAVTDAATINMMSLSAKTRENLLRSYFGVKGIEYNIGRVPIASCDYSTHEYTYLDTPNDFNLTTFALAKEDMDYKIPILKHIYNITAKPISLYASSWSAPAWMKTNDNEIGRGWLKGQAGDEYHKTWAKYYTKFFDEYKKHGFEFWGMTVQNEPSNGLLTSCSWQCLGFTAETERDFIKTDLGPEMHNAGYEKIKIMILDDQRMFLPTWPKIVFGDKEAEKYVSGVGVHWYWNWLVGPTVLADTHNAFPDKFILATEACNKDSPGPDLGSWDDGVKYSNDILDNLNNWAVGWVDWNMCLDINGGPNWAKNYDDSPIIANATADEFYKQPMFYHLGHFSKFLPEGSVRIHSSANTEGPLKFVAAVTPSKQTVLVVLNPSSDEIPITVMGKPYSFNYTIPADSIQTFTWN